MELARKYAEVNEDVLAPLAPPSPRFYLVAGALALLVAWAAICWMVQVELGMGVAGVTHPVGWGLYIATFVFWVGIAHSGTLISAILYLVRSRWRTAVSRSAEAMTVFAVMTAGLFPLIHLGRLWVFYYILPYPSQRQLWPNFMSPLLWDVVAVSTYLTVSSIFFYVGLLPDLGAARDAWEQGAGENHWRSRLYRWLSLGWSGSGNQWRHISRGYLFFAALATPLVVSVHSVVSWDFAVGILPGWHTTIFAPYFVAGAIHSGLAMVLTLLIPMRRLFRLERLINLDHFESIAQTMLVTTLIVGYAYVVEPFIAWYSGDLYEQQFALWRAAGWMAPIYWGLFVLNVFVPLLFVFRRMRRSIGALFAISILVNIGMWLERYFIVIGSTSHDFLPHNWDTYAPTWVEWSIFVGSFSFFMLFFLFFSKYLPTVPISDIKEDLGRDAEAGEERGQSGECRSQKGDTGGQSGDWRSQGGELGDRSVGWRSHEGVLAVFRNPAGVVEGIRRMQAVGLTRLETFSPRRLHEAEPLLGRGPSPVRFLTLAGAVAGCAGGFGLAVYAATSYGLIVGGKHPISLIPYCVVGFEATILLGTLGNFLGVLLFSRLGPPWLPHAYVRRFSRDRFGLFVGCAPEQAGAVRALLEPAGPEETRDVG